jgi:catalase (peroxidase I)
VIPSICQVDVLVNLMDMAVDMNKAIAPQWLRLAFHDAGTFNQQVQEGGANGCLLTDDNMRQQDENMNLDLAVETLRFVQSSMVDIRLSSADMIQFAGFFAAVRQRGTPGLDSAKRLELRTAFEWGRPDEVNCQTDWTNNLPGFQLNADGANIPQRCSFAGGEIKKKMMDRNGFTAREATALIGAHTIGLTRNVFGPDLAGPWVANGADEATPQGPVFDNAFHDFLIHSIPANTVREFSAGNTSTQSPAPFTTTFPDWFKADATDLNHLDTDIVLAFPSQDTNVHPHFDTFSREFAGSNTEFINAFMAALDKMSKLGVGVPLLSARSCTTLTTVPGPTTGFASPVSAPTTAAAVPVDFGSGMMASMDVAEENLQLTLVERQDEIEMLTTPLN